MDKWGQCIVIMTTRTDTCKKGVIIQDFYLLFRGESWGSVGDQIAVIPRITNGTPEIFILYLRIWLEVEAVFLHAFGMYSTEEIGVVGVV
jgi:hypothetical protein